MYFKQSIDLIFDQEQKKGTLTKELVKKIIEKIVDEYVKLKPTSQEEYNVYILNAAALVILISQKANELGIDISLLEVSQELVKTFAKHSLDK